VDWEVKCAKCNNYYPIADVFQYDNGYYCKKCYKRVKGLQSDASVDVKCKICGRTIPPGETRVKDGYVYCVLCYIKSFSPPLRGELVQEFSKFNETKCESCGKVLTRYDDKVQDGGKFYCKPCYKKSESVTAYGMVNKSGFLPRSPVTTVSDATILFECTSCGIILTPDKLKEGKDGRVICPKCNSILPIRVRVAETAKNVKDADYSPTAQLFKCLGDPCRVKIIELLSQNELCVYEVVEMTGFQYSAISYHLKMLKGLGLVRSSEKGNFMVYSLTGKGATIHEFIEKSRGLT
jgi:DNA-binding transcriptional ArsR family regulator/formylmethanofuran dehydrogenase subunit E